MKKGKSVLKLFATVLLAIVVAWWVRSAWYTPAWAPIRENVDQVGTTIGKVYHQYVQPLLADKQNENAEANPSTTPAPELRGPYRVIRVIDGDTAIIEIDDAETRVRFIGIDTPESVNPDENKNTLEGQLASQFTKNLLSGKQVWLEYDIERLDAYGRTLAYIYLDPEDPITVQEQILLAGMATTLTIQPNSKYADTFYAAQVSARESGAGLWATDFWSS